MVSHAASRPRKMLHDLKSAAIWVVLSNVLMTDVVMLDVAAAILVVNPRVAAMFATNLHVVAISAVSHLAVDAIPMAMVAAMAVAVS